TSSELLSCLGEFLLRRCNRLRHFQTTECVAWIRSVDRALLASGWQDVPFINPANVVFLYMLVRNSVDASIVTVDELRSTVLACLYLAYSYMGNEISYPLKPFLAIARIDSDRRGRFWYRCVKVADDSSWRMLRLNSDPAYFARLFRDLKSFS
ncbi:hypothetical protein HELRODRAFT_136797, partial [Helobdella robusta]|uniref:Cyclin-dependent kinase 5 activator n=1 Tax=Helobdella robusta TaxID=6412 RepID=T1EIG0_HELRO